MGELKSLKAVADRELVRRLQAGDDGAVNDFARDYRPRIQQLALRYLKNAEDAEEVTQDVLLKAVAKIADFRGDAALSSWLYRVTFNASMSRLRHLRATRSQTRGAARIRKSRTAYASPEIPDWSAMADELALRRQMRRRLATAVRLLPEIYRAPVILRDFRGLSTEEASSALRVNDQTLKSGCTVAGCYCAAICQILRTVWCSIARRRSCARNARNTKTDSQKSWRFGFRVPRGTCLRLCGLSVTVIDPAPYRVARDLASTASVRAIAPRRVGRG